MGPIFSILSSNGPVLKLDGEPSLTILCEWGNIEQCIIFICNQLKMTTLKSPRLGMQYLFHSIQYVIYLGTAFTLMFTIFGYVWGLSI